MSYIFQKGTTDVSIEVYIVDSGDGTPETGVVFNTAGIDLFYRRDGAAVVSITEADLATPALTDAHADGGFLAIRNGLYRLDLPDGACASGVDKVVVGGTVTGMVVLPVVIQLVDYDPFDSVRLGMTALPNAAADAAGGLPISDAGGLDMDGMVIQGLKDAGIVLSSSTIETVTDQTNFIIPATDDAPDNDAYNDLTAVFIDGSDANQRSVRSVLNYVASTRSVEVDAAPDFTITTSDTLVLLSGSNARAVWNRVLIGATHNEVNSAGRRIRQLQDAGGYALGAIWIDTVNGTAGTTNNENGTVENPVDSIADANTLAALRNFARFVMTPGSSITFAAAQENQTFLGLNWDLALGGQSISNSHFTGADVTGIGTSATEVHFDHCEIGDVTLDAAHIDQCDLSGTIILAAAATYFLLNCYHAGNVVVDFGAAVGNTTVHIHDSHGAITVKNMGQSGTDVLHFDSSGGKLTLDNTNIGGTVNLNGVFELSDSSSGMTINKDGHLNVDRILRTQMTEAYAANGVAPTLEQFQFAIHQFLMQFGILGTDYTVRKLDDTTTAFVVTLDDATNPTGAKRV